MNIKLIVLVAALGYFVDVFDLVLFSIVRTSSLNDLGVGKEGLLEVGVQLLNAQMFGMLIGGIFWGMIGDKLGRIQSLFGSILLYSLANIANGFVNTVEQYEVLRFISGLGLAGEIGGAITLVGEVLSKERRGLGTALVATAGAAGAVAATYTANLLTWRNMYILGGALGLCLLVLRIAIAESSVFEHVKNQKDLSRGNPLLLVNNKDRALRFISCILIGVQFMFSWGFIATFSPEIASTSLNLSISSAATPIAYFAIGVTLGDICCGVISQYLQSRKNTMYLFILAQAASWIGLIHLNFSSHTIFNLWFLPLGFFGGIWAVLITTASEQFGTNLRATVTCMVPNFIRGTTVPLGYAFLNLKSSIGVLEAVQIIAATSCILGLIGIKLIRESFAIPLNYVETKTGQDDYQLQEEQEFDRVEGWR